jgi:hypothetical protein
MDDRNRAPETIAAPGAEMSFTERLTGVFFEPQNTFASINRKPTWLGMFLIVAVLGVGVTYALTARMDYQTYMRKALQMNPLTKNMPEEQIQALVARPRSAFQTYSQFVMAPVTILAVYAALAGIFLLVFMLMGAAIPYKKALASTVWGMAPPAIIVTLLSIVFIMVKDPATLDINPAGNVVSNLGLLVSASDHPGLASLLSSIDVFSFWAVFLLATGFSACSERRLTRGKAAAGILALWAVFVLGKAWFMS